MFGRRKADQPPLPLDTWNEKRQSEYERWNSFPKLAPVTCPKCGANMMDQYHVDYTAGVPARRQVICVACNHSDYRLLGADDCHSQCSALNDLIKKRSE